MGFGAGSRFCGKTTAATQNVHIVRFMFLLIANIKQLIMMIMNDLSFLEIQHLKALTFNAQLFTADLVEVDDLDKYRACFKNDTNTN